MSYDAKRFTCDINNLLTVYKNFLPHVAKTDFLEWKVSYFSHNGIIQIINDTIITLMHLYDYRKMLNLTNSSLFYNVIIIIIIIKFIYNVYLCKALGANKV